MASGKFDWNQFEAEDAAPGAESQPKFAWNQFEVEPPPAPESKTFAERISDPDRWKAVLGVSKKYNAAGELRGQPGNQFDAVAAGTPPLVVPAGALGAFGKAAVALGEGQGLGYSAGRTALSATQGAAMSALDRKEGESAQDKIDRAKSGAKLAGGIQLAAESVPVVGKAIGYGANKISSALSGIKDSLIENYAKRTDLVNDLIKSSGGDMTEAADQVRNELSQGIQNTKRALGKQIGSALEAAGPDKTMHVGPVLDALDTVKSRINPTLNPEGHAEIDEMAKRIFSLADENGNISPAQMHEVKEFLAERGKSAYMKGGQIFQSGRDAQQAAKAASAVARKTVNAAIPEVAQANNQLSAMHSIEDNLNKNLLAAGKSDGALFAAGSGANPRNEKMLAQLGNLAGVDAVGRAKDLATAREFAKPSLLPAYGNGKSLAGLAVAGGAAHMAGPLGYLAAAPASPAAIKAAINLGNGIGKIGNKLGIPSAAQFVRQSPFAAQAGVQLAAGQIRRANTDNPMLGNPPPESLEPPPTLMQNQAPADRAPAKGPDAWAQSGLGKLGIEDQAMSAKLLADPKAKELLIRASDLTPGSKAMKSIMDQIKARYSK